MRWSPVMWSSVKPRSSNSLMMSRFFLGIVLPPSLCRASVLLNRREPVLKLRGHLHLAGCHAVHHQDTRDAVLTLELGQLLSRVTQSYLFHAACSLCWAA